MFTIFTTHYMPLWTKKSCNINCIIAACVSTCHTITSIKCLVLMGIAYIPMIYWKYNSDGFMKCCTTWTKAVRKIYHIKTISNTWWLLRLWIDQLHISYQLYARDIKLLIQLFVAIIFLLSNVCPMLTIILIHLLVMKCIFLDISLVLM